MQQVLFNVPVKTYMGDDSFGRIGEEAVRFGNKALVVTSSSVAETGLAERLIKILEAKGISAIIYNNIGPDSDSSAVDEAVALASAGKAQMVIGLGGVKTLSTARGVAVLARSGIRADDFIDGLRPNAVALPYIGVPTACRDPFMFKDAIMLIDRRSRRALLRRTPDLYPASVFIDPEAASSIPSATFTFSIMETLMYAVEGFISAKGNFLSECLFLKAISAVVTSERRIDENTDDKDAYLKAARAGLTAATGLSMAGPGFGAALSMIIAAKARVPRVLVAAVMLPIVLEYGVKVCPEKIARLAPILNESTEGLSSIAAAERVIETIRHRIGLKRVQIRLAEFNLGVDDLSGIAEAVRNFDFMIQLPAPLTTEDIISMLRKSL